MASKALPGEHYCAAHQGNHSHYAAHNCTVCVLTAQRDELAKTLNEVNKAIFAVGAPIGSANYFLIRELAVDVLVKHNLFERRNPVKP